MFINEDMDLKQEEGGEFRYLTLVFSRAAQKQNTPLGI